MSIKTSKHNVFSIILFVITALYILFIWWHSTLSAEESTVESNNVLYFFLNFFKSIGINAELSDYIIRKSAHFCEFALLGLLCMWCSYIKTKNIVHNFMPAGFVCLATAVVDELIQINSEGRSAEVTDVALDFFGAVSGVLFFLLVLLIIRLFKKVRQR